MNPVRYLQDTFRHGWKLGLVRLKIQFKRNIWRKVPNPICLVKGHSPYKFISWTGYGTNCRRCQQRLTYQKHGNGI